MLQYSIEALDYKDLEVLVAALEGATLSKQSTRLLSVDNNNGNTGPSSLVNVLADPEFARLL